MPRKRFKDLPACALYNESDLEIPTVDAKVLHRPLEKMPEFMRISFKTLTSIVPLDLDFAQMHRRVLVIDRNTVVELRDRQYGGALREEGSGFLYGYSYEANLVAGYFKDIHEEGMLWWYRQRKIDGFLPEIKIGETGRDDFQNRITEQFSGRRVGVGHPQRPIILFVIYSPQVKGMNGLEARVHQKLKEMGCWLRDANVFEGNAPGDEWFEVPVGKAYSIATKHNQQIFKESLSFQKSVESYSDFRH